MHLQFLLFSITQAQNQGDRAQKFRGTWWGGVHASLLDDRLLSLKTIDGWRVILTRGASESALHFAPVPRLNNLDGADEVFPPNNDTTVKGYLDKIENAGYMVQVYTNSENFIGGNQSQFEEFAESWKEWCDTNPTAQAFINSRSYHRKAGFPNRPYMFCYAEFVVKYYSQQFGKQIDLWTFDAGHVMETHGDNATSGNVDDQRIYLAFAEAARAGNDEIAVAFNNGRSNSNFPGYPYAHATRADDFTFGHAFGGNGNHASKSGPQFGLNYRHIERMTATNGYVHDEGRETWDDNIVGHFSSKLSTAAWDFGGTPAWEQRDFNEWNAEALSAGGMMTWYGSYNRPNTFVYDWVYPQLKATDDYLFARGISVNSDNDNPSGFDAFSRIEAEDFTSQSGIRTETGSEGVNVGFIDNGDYLRFEDVDFADGIEAFRVRVASATNGGDIQVRLNSPTGRLLGTVAVGNTGGWQNWVTRTIDVGFVVGVRDLYLVFKGDRGSLMNVNWLRFTAPNITDDNNNNTVVHITKRNATGFALDGNRGGANGQNLYLWNENNANVNQQWIEIDRGNGYYTYQKMGTNFVIDGDNGGSNRQNVHLWTINENNQNQHWQKVAVGRGVFKLIKRNAPGFALNGGNGGADGQNVNLFDASSTSQNLQWIITEIPGVSIKSDITTTEKIVMFPNPVESIVTIQGAENATIRIYDMNGKTILTKHKISQNETLNLRQLSVGIYYAQVNRLQGSEVIKLIKQ